MTIVDVSQYAFKILTARLTKCATGALVEVSHLTNRERSVLSRIYLESLTRNEAYNFLIEVSNQPSIEKDDLGKIVVSLLEKGLLTKSGPNFILSANGRKEMTVVLAGGGFDIIHPGHLETLEKAKALGDMLIVSVSRDVTFERNKQRKPLHNETQRAKLVFALKVVDGVILGSKNDILETVDFVKPDIIALGYDQFHSEAKILEGARNRGIDVKVVRLESTIPAIKTSTILAKAEESLGET